MAAQRPQSASLRQPSPPPPHNSSFNPTATWVRNNLSLLLSSFALRRLTTLDSTIALFIDHQRADLLASARRQDSGLWTADVAVTFWTVSQDHWTPPPEPTRLPNPPPSVWSGLQDTEERDCWADKGTFHSGAAAKCWNSQKRKQLMPLDDSGRVAPPAPPHTQQLSHPLHLPTDTVDHAA